MADVDRRGIRDLHALLGKYERIHALRLARLADRSSQAPSGELVALARAFPGALRELDQMPLESIRHRIAALHRCVRAGAPPEPWMPTTTLFHAEMRGALATKRWLARRRDVTPELEEAFRETLPSLPHPADAARFDGALGHVARPPQGRLVDLVLRRIASTLGTSVAEVRAHVFPSSAPGRSNSSEDDCLNDGYLDGEEPPEGVVPPEGAAPPGAAAPPGDAAPPEAAGDGELLAASLEPLPSPAEGAPASPLALGLADE